MVRGVSLNSIRTLLQIPLPAPVTRYRTEHDTTVRGWWNDTRGWNYIEFLRSGWAGACSAKTEWVIGFHGHRSYRDSSSEGSNETKNATKKWVNGFLCVTHTVRGFFLLKIHPARTVSEFSLCFGGICSNSLMAFIWHISGQEKKWARTKKTPVSKWLEGCFN